MAPSSRQLHGMSPIDKHEGDQGGEKINYSCMEDSSNSGSPSSNSRSHRLFRGRPRLMSNDSGLVRNSDPVVSRRRLFSWSSNTNEQGSCIESNDEETRPSRLPPVDYLSKTLQGAIRKFTLGSDDNSDVRSSTSQSFEGGLDDFKDDKDDDDDDVLSTLSSLSANSREIPAGDKAVPERDSEPRFRPPGSVYLPANVELDEQPNSHLTIISEKSSCPPSPIASTCSHSCLSPNSFQSNPSSRFSNSLRQPSRSHAMRSLRKPSLSRSATSASQWSSASPDPKLLGSRPHRISQRSVSSSNYTIGSVVGQTIASQITGSTSLSYSESTWVSGGVSATTRTTLSNPTSMTPPRPSPQKQHSGRRRRPAAKLVKDELKHMIGRVATPIRRLSGIKSEEPDLHRAKGCLT